jgi:hypothetical protein
VSAEVVSLEQVRARRLPVPFLPPARQDPPQAMIRAAGDLWLAESVRLVGEELVNRITRTNAPLLPDERAALMRASAALLGQPEGVG